MTFSPRGPYLRSICSWPTGLASSAFHPQMKPSRFRHFSYTSFDLGNGHFHMRPFHTYRITNASKHVGNRVSHHSRLFPLSCLITNLPCEHREPTLVQQGCENRFGRFQICDRPHEVGRKVCTDVPDEPEIWVLETLWRFLIFLPQQKPVKKFTN